MTKACPVKSLISVSEENANLERSITDMRDSEDTVDSRYFDLA